MTAKSYQVLTQAGAIGASGVAVIIYGINILSNGTGNGNIELHNGTDDSGTYEIMIDGTINKGTYHPFVDEGILFPSGCYLSPDAGVDSATVIFKYN